MKTWAVAALLASACGRVGFEARSGPGDATGDGGNNGGDGTTTGDGLVDAFFGSGPAAVSCGTLAMTCGPTGTALCCESIAIPGGTYLRMNDVGSDGQYPSTSYPATLSAFRLDKYEVTVGRFRKFVEAGQGTQASPPAAGAGLHPNIANSGWDPTWNSILATDTTALRTALTCPAQIVAWTDAPGPNESRPVNCITWYEAMAFCAWDGGWLPTEAEWNYAAVGGDEQRAYPWSNPPSTLPLDPSTYASYWVDSTKQCYGDMVNGCAVTDFVPVGSKPAGDGRWGHSELGGNVQEWSLDWSGTLPMPCNDCANLTTSTMRAFHGGSGFVSSLYLRGAFRNGGDPAGRLGQLGVRCARPL